MHRSPEFEETYETLLSEGSIPPEDSRRTFGLCRDCFHDQTWAVGGNRNPTTRPCCVDLLKVWADITPTEILSVEAIAREIRRELVRVAQGMKRSHRLIRTAILEWDSKTPKSDRILWNPKFGGTLSSIINAGQYHYNNRWEVRAEGKIYRSDVEPGDSTTVATLRSLEQIAKRKLFVQAIDLTGTCQMGFVRVEKVSNRILRKVRG